MKDFLRLCVFGGRGRRTRVMLHVFPVTLQKTLRGR